MVRGTINFQVFESTILFHMLLVFRDLLMRVDWEVSQIRRLFSHMIFTALCCYTKSGGLLHCKPYFAFDRRMHLERFSDAPCTIATRSQKISARFEWQFLQRRVHYEQLRSSICTCTWGGNDIDSFP
jgi:hypothetical protein